MVDFVQPWYAHGKKLLPNSMPLQMLWLMYIGSIGLNKATSYSLLVDKEEGPQKCVGVDKGVGSVKVALKLHTCDYYKFRHSG